MQTKPGETGEQPGTDFALPRCSDIAVQYLFIAVLSNLELERRIEIDKLAINIYHSRSAA